jgi:hypothetical protein
MAQFRSESKSMNRPTLCLVILCLVSINHVNAQTKIKILRPKEELSTGFLDLSLNRINLVHDQYPSFRGDSIRISVKEQGFDTTDIDLVGRSFHTGRASSITTSHAAIMATIIAGAGNSSQEALGVAPAASVGSTSFANLFAEPELFFRQNGISIQNHSYGTVVESFYGPEAASYDSLAHAFPELSLVFSSGNSGTAASATGPYAGLAGVANLTGNFKMAKNIITVGATDSLGVLEALSSRGPAYDGRVKPELTAFGQDGSSGASALVSGTVALLQQAYRRAFNILPSSSLVKALLLNSAEDAGPAHVDYQYGYGRLNAWDALQTFQEGRWQFDSVANGQTKTISIQVPVGMSQLRVLTAWNDLPASVNNNKALIQDLDLKLIDPANTSYLPWVLNPSPSLATLVQPATRNIDTLNNIEQVTIDNPAAGIYTVRIAGTHVTGQQPFAVVWQFDSADRFRFTYPTASDPLRAGGRTVLRWLSNRGGNGILEYNIDGGNWQPIAAGVSAASLFYIWQAPDTFGVIRIRFRHTGFSDVVSDSAILADAPELVTGFNCTDSFLLLWNGVQPRNYRVYELGAKYLQPFRNTTDTTVLLLKSQHPSLYYAVAPVIAGREGPRSNTLKYDAQGVGCYFRSFFLSSQDGSVAGFTATIGTTIGVAALSLQQQSGVDFITRKTLSPVNSTSFTLVDSNLHEGINLYRLQLLLTNGTVLTSDVVPVYYFPGLPVLVFPNPAHQGQPIRIYSNEAGRYQVQVIDAAGRTVHTQTLNGLATDIPLLVLPKGIYFIRIIQESGRVAMKKIVVY